MSESTKGMSDRDFQQVIKLAFNDNDKTLAVGGFVGTKIGHKVTRSVVSSTVDDFTYLDSGTTLYVIRITYSNAAHDDVDSAERIS